MQTTFSHVVDLTHTLHAGVPSWDGSCGFHQTLQLDYEQCSAPELFRIFEIRTRAGMGTHIDAPAHCIPGGRTIEQLPLAELITELYVVILDGIVSESTIVLPEDIHRTEDTHGAIPEGAFVVFGTGWEKRWSDPVAYRNNLLFPSVHESTADLLLERNVAGIGIDTLSPDAGGHAFPVHRKLLGSGKYIVENVANVREVPQRGATVFVLPMKVSEGTEAPIRLIAAW